ncbi:TonB-dependent receptor family protein [Flavihumibacter stibioxidans]|uniref:TonB-dependent receptor n=1 Tax=Flavihumibacter stibioxidans TaxID=1834163 RepID=A0ABR7M802_9BACT|nr:TonB-dependent receptor [Flavihumibacter stibioxidans]MBC6491072.1 hypothetical protein [Flavihumibacter stibioxidans]
MKKTSTYLTIISAMLALYLPALAQVKGRHLPDSIRIHALDSILIIANQQRSQMLTLAPVKGTYIYSGKKTEILHVSAMDANKVDNNPRQLFAKVPGVYVYENDGSGNQVNIATRGLTAHRSWEMNVRLNDVMTNSDLYGYPASHFNAPTESIDRIEIVRGSGALQYGGQFGGMVNYITKEADSTRKFSFESSNSTGSYGLLSTFNAIGGKIKKLSYYSYINYRQSNGYRDNSEYDYLAAHAHVQYEFNKRLKLRMEYNFMEYVNHLNGGLTDAQFRENPRQSTRSRNYYSPSIHVPSLHLDYSISRNTTLNLISSAILGSRNSVQFIALSTVPDTINATTGNYNHRQVDIDHYNSYANEARIKHHYHWLGNKQTIVAGIRYINNNLIRKQMGKGTTGSDYDLRLTDPVWGRDLGFRTSNISFFAENLLQVHPKLTFTTGLRYENGRTKMNGSIRNFNPADIPVTIAHKFFLLGAGIQYELNNTIQVFANWSQAYRPVLFADVIPATTLNKIDPGIRDAFGSNAELGIRGTAGNRFRFDLTFFSLQYKHRTGNIALTDESGNTYLYKTNTGNSLSQGIEFYGEAILLGHLNTGSGRPDAKRGIRLSVFTSTAIIHARYTKGTIVAGRSNLDVKGNRIEAAPPLISRNGLQGRYGKISGLIQYSYTSSSYADPLNTAEPNASGTIGKVPAYHLFDLNLSYRITSAVTARFMLNNIFNKQYFTERPAFFPGPGGLYPADGRSLIFSVGIKL